ncbi:acyltransferase [Dechloromonas sp. ZS-1]|uniref:acyltransferase n=1 Tax=Dechloromonas sp. ZS-1 TaxID=3138067 RepID=UPI0031FCD224
MSLLSLATNRFILLLRGLLRIRKVCFLGRGVKLRNKRYLAIGRSVTIQDGVSIDALSKCGVFLGDNCNIGPMTIIQATGVLTNIGMGLNIGANSGIGGFSFIGCGGGVRIGSNVIMGQYVSFHSENHQFDDLGKPIREQGVTRIGIEIGDDCWVGAKATFLDGARVGNGCVIAAGSVVRGDFPSFSILAGVPARVVRSRLDQVAEIRPTED